VEPLAPVNAAYLVPPEVLGGEDVDAAPGFQLQEVGVSGDDAGAAPLPGSGKNEIVVRVPADGVIQGRRRGEGEAGPEESQGFSDPGRRNPGLTDQRPSQLFQNLFGDNDLVIQRAVLHQIVACAAAEKGRHEDVGVQKHLQETSRNTSSSV
jgi:hypothetical protein